MSQRLSPLHMKLPPHEVMEWKGWQVVSTYLGENPHSPLAVTDLSHIPKYTLQSRRLGSMHSGDKRIPERPGGVSLQKGIMITRLTPSECRLMVLDRTQEVQYGPEYTDVTDAFAAFALMGPRCLDALSKLSAVDLEGSRTSPPSAALAPLEEITCLFIYLKGRRGIPGLIVSVARGYGQFLLKAFTDAGKEWGMSPAGWQRFRAWLP